MPAYQSIPDRAEYHIQYDFMLYLPACIRLSRTLQYCDQSLAPNRGKTCPIPVEQTLYRPGFVPSVL